AEIHRVLRPGSLFAVYDIMRRSDSPLPYPMPWAQTEATSFVETPETYRQLLKSNGFAVEVEHDRRNFVLDLARDMRAKMQTEGPPPLGLHVIIGPAARPRMDNVFRALEEGLIAPVEIIARTP